MPTYSNLPAGADAAEYKRSLVIAFDCTGFSDEQIAELTASVWAQGEALHGASDDEGYPDVAGTVSATVPFIFPNDSALDGALTVGAEGLEDDPHLALCQTHGWSQITEEGSNAGFGGEGFSWANLLCGCSLAEHGDPASLA